jgi:hypothetical protein
MRLPISWSMKRGQLMLYLLVSLSDVHSFLGYPRVAEMCPWFALFSSILEIL